MTHLPPRDDVVRQSRPVDRRDEAENDAEDVAARRRAFVRDWIASRHKSVTLALGSMLFVPLLLRADAAEAQIPGDALVQASSIPGVDGVILNADGSVNLTLGNGQVIQIPASEVTVLADGTVAISVAAAEYVAGLAGVAAAGGIGAGALGLAAGAAGLAVAMGGDKGPGVTVELASGGATLNAGQVLAGAQFTGKTEPDSEVRVRIGDFELITKSDADGNFSVTFAAADLPPDGTYTAIVEVYELDKDGKPGTEPEATANFEFRIDTVPPVIAITTPIAGDDIINAAEKGQPLTVSGTTDAENGRVVTVTLTGPGGYEVSATGTVAGGAWSASFTAAQLAGMPDGAVVSVSANVSDAAGNPAVTATVTVDTDFTAPTIAIDATLAGNNVFTKLNEANGLEVTGTTNAEAGQVVRVTYNGVDYVSAPLTGATWSVTIPAGAFAGVATGQTLGAITARVSDAAGNPSAVASGPAISVDLTGPSLSINPIATDDVINIAESGSDVTISGTASGADGETVTVRIDATAPNAVPPLFTDTAVVAAGGAWQVTVPAATAAGLADGGTFRVSADVSDAENIPAPTATRDFTTDFTPPTIAIDTPVAGDDVLNIAEQGQPLTISGTTTAENGQVVTVGFAFAGTFFTTTAQGGAWSVTIPTSLLGTLPTGASVPITANVSDVAGNPAIQASHDIDTDFTPPVVAIDPVTGNNELTLADKGNDVTVTGTTDAEPGTTVQAAFNGLPLAAAVVVAGAPGANTWSTIIPAALTDGLEDESSYTLTAQVSDAAGNPSTVVEQSLTTDFSQPTITINAISTDDIINADESGDPVVFSGTTTNLEVGRTISFVITGTGGVNIPFSTTVQAGGSFSTSVDIGATLANIGSYTVTANATNVAGVDAVPGIREFTTDYIAPFVTIDTPIAGDDTVNLAERNAGITVTGTTDAEDGQQVAVNTGFGATIFGTVSGGTWSAEISSGQLQLLADGGNFTLTANLTDRAGNPAPQAQAPFSTDYTPPSLNINPVAGDNVINIAERDAGITVSGTSDAEGRTVTVELEPIFAIKTATVTGGVWSVTFAPADLAGLQDGAASATASVDDAAGNQTTIQRDLVADLTPPDLTVDPLDIGAFLNAAEAAFAVTVTGTVTGNDGQPVVVSVGGVDQAAVIGAGGAWTATFPAGALSGLPEGAAAFSVATQDAAGNPASATSAGFTVDFTPPTVTVDSHALDGLIVGSSSGLNAGDEVTVSVNGTEYKTTVGNDGSWELQLQKGAAANSWVQTGLAYNQAFNATATVSDAAGNIGSSGEKSVLLYMPGGYAVFETGRGGATASYDLMFDTPGPNAPSGFAMGVLLEFNPALVSYSSPLVGAIPGGFLLINTSIAGNPGAVSFTGAGTVALDVNDPIIQFTMNLLDASSVVRYDIKVAATQSEGGNSETWIGTSAGETITVAAIDSVVQGHGGNDTVDLSAGGRNTVIFEADPAANGVDTIIGFEAGNAADRPDKIGFSGLQGVAGLRGDGADSRGLGSELFENLGFVKLNTALDNLDAVTLANAAAGFVGEAAGDVIYLLASDGTDTALAQITYTDVDVATAQIMATFVGLADATDISSNEILGFTST